MDVKVKLDIENAPPQFIVEVWIVGFESPAPAVVDFPFYDGALHPAFYPVRGPVLYPRHELVPAQTGHAAFHLSLQIGATVIQTTYPFVPNPSTVCIDLVYVEPTESGSAKTCTRRRASANVSGDLTDMARLTLSTVTGRDPIRKYEAPLMRTRDFPFVSQTKPIKFPLEMELDEYRRTKRAGTAYVATNFALKPIWTADDEEQLHALSQRWWKARQNERTELKGRMRDLYMNPFYDANRTTPFLPGPFMTFHSYTLNATEDWWTKNLEVVKSRRPDLRIDSYDFMVRLVKCWASTRPYVRDWVWDGAFDLGDDKSVLEYQTANDCEDFAWHVARVFAALQHGTFTNAELKVVQRTANRWTCFVVYGTMLTDIDDTDASAIRATLKGDWDDTSHAFTVFVPAFTGLTFRGSPLLAVGEATVLTSPNVVPDETAPLQTIQKVQAYIEKNHPHAVCFEHHEHYKKPYMVVHANIALLMRVSTEWPWAFRIRAPQLVSVSDLFDASKTFELVPVPGLEPMMPFARKIERLERPLPLLGKWDEKKRAEKTAWCARWSASTPAPKLFSVFIDLAEGGYWDERTCSYREYDGRFDSLFQFLGSFGKVTVQPDTGHMVRVDVAAQV